MCVGAERILVKGINYENKTKTVKNMTLSMSSNETANLWLSQLNQMSDSMINLKLAGFPFFVHMMILRLSSL